MGPPPALPLKKCRFARLVGGTELTAWSVIFIATATWAQAQDTQNSLGTSQDCTEILVGYEDDPTLTNEEKLALMDRGLFQSLSRFDACQNAAQGGGGGGSNGAGGGGSGAGGGASVASSDMAGTEAPPSKTDGQTDEFDASSSSGQSDMEGEAAGGSPEQDGEISNNGKVPEDIPSADNDSVLEAQIRQAAINETNPKVKAKLWNEYRRYKGLPTVN